MTQTGTEDLAPGDEAPAGAQGTGENVCRRCQGSGTVDGATCPVCDGSGKVIEGVGGG
jgi:DnaJ-class molecular chaperone